MVISQHKNRFWGVIFDVEGHDFEGPRASKAHIYTVFRTDQTCHTTRPLPPYIADLGARKADRHREFPGERVLTNLCTLYEERETTERKISNSE